MRTGLWDRQGATIASRYKEMYGVELCFAQTNVNHFTLTDSRNTNKSYKKYHAQADPKQFIIR